MPQATERPPSGGLFVCRVPALTRACASSLIREFRCAFSSTFYRRMQSDDGSTPIPPNTRPIRGCRHPAVAPPIFCGQPFKPFYCWRHLIAHVSCKDHWGYLMSLVKNLALAAVVALAARRPAALRRKLISFYGRPTDSILHLSLSILRTDSICVICFQFAIRK